MNKKKIFKTVKHKAVNFLLEEDGKISKSEILKAGTVIFTISMIGSVAGGQHFYHANNIQIDNKIIDKTVQTTHSNHSSHSSHGSHGSW